MVKQFFKKVSNDFLDLLYPQNITCLNCNKELQDENYLCKDCLNNFVKINKACQKCGNPTNSQTEYCDDCKGNERNFDKAMSPFEYEGAPKNLIYKLKYGKQKYIAKVFASELVNCFLKNKLGNIDIVTCVPLNEKRLKERRFNQAEEISKEFVKELRLRDIKIEENYNLIKRVKNTPTQTNLTKQERLNNLKDAFNLSCKKEIIKDKTILVIDDIFTTGATLEEISKILKRNKAKNVYCLTVCHTNINRYKETT